MILGGLLSCTNPQIDPELEKKIKRLGTLQCMADAQADQMRPYFLEVKELGLESHPEFLKQKRKYHRCLASINAEIQPLLSDFDAAVLRMGGQSTERGRMLYDLLEQSRREADCNFMTFCRLRFDATAWAASKKE